MTTSRRTGAGRLVPSEFRRRSHCWSRWSRSERRTAGAASGATTAALRDAGSAPAAAQPASLVVDLPPVRRGPPVLCARSERARPVTRRGRTRGRAADQLLSRRRPAARYARIPRRFHPSRAGRSTTFHVEREKTPQRDVLGTLREAGRPSSGQPGCGGAESPPTRARISRHGSRTVLRTMRGRASHVRGEHALQTVSGKPIVPLRSPRRTTCSLASTSLKRERPEESPPTGRTVFDSSPGGPIASHVERFGRLSLAVVPAAVLSDRSFRTPTAANSGLARTISPSRYSDAGMSRSAMIGV